MAVPLLVVEARTVLQGGHDPDAPEETVEIHGVVGDILRTGSHSEDGRGVGVAGPPEPFAVVAAHRRGKPEGRPQGVDGSYLPVVDSEDDGVAPLPGPERVPDRGHGSHQLGPAHGLAQLLVGTGGPPGVPCRKDRQHHRKGDRRAQRGQGQKARQPVRPGVQPRFSTHGSCRQEIDVGAGEVVDLAPRGDGEEHEQQSVGQHQGPPRWASDGGPATRGRGW